MKRAFSRKNFWESLPGSLKNGLAPLVSLVPPGALLGRRFRTALDFARQADRWPAERARQYQLDELRRICELAARTPFYARAFKQAHFDPRDLRSPEDLRHLPTIDKHTINSNHDAMLTAPRSSAGVDCVATSGTSGQPLRFCVPADRSATEYGYLVATWERAGYQLGMPMAVLRGKGVEADRTGLHHQYDPILRQHTYSSYHTSEADLRAYVRHIATLGPCFLHAYPSSAAMLAHFLHRAEMALPANLLGILAGSEAVLPEERQHVTQVLDCPYFSWYGHTEKLVLAAECEHSSDYHVWPTYGYFELLDEQGRPVELGQRGEIVGTGFINHVLPFIRYRTGDFARYKADRCLACGREQVVLTDVEGRRYDGGLRALDGSIISLLVISLREEPFGLIRDYQFRQSQPGKAVLCVLPEYAPTAEQKENLRRWAEHTLHGQISLELELVDKLVTTANGKRLRLIREGEPVQSAVGPTSWGQPVLP
jgi:phenylacetate-CoA ligase